MKGKLLINGKDAYEHYGVIIEYGGYKALVQYPPLKSVASETWLEDNGIDPDLSSPQLDSREFDLSFIRFNNDKIEELLFDLANAPSPKDCVSPSDHKHITNISSAYLDFEFVDFGLKLRLRLVSQASLQSIQHLDKFTLRFAHDTPFENYTHALPIDIGVKQRGYELRITQTDGEQVFKSLSDYGITVLDGTDTEIAKSPAVKKNLLTNINSKKGAIYNGNKVVFEQKDVSVKCIIHNVDLTTFWRNYLAFLHDLTQPNERTFFTEKLYEEYPCHYKSSSVSEFVIVHSKVWCKFSVTLAFYSFRVGERLHLLAGEDGSLILDEEGINCIDMK